MEENAIIDWKTEKEFRENANLFYEKSTTYIRMPYYEGIFIETVCAAFAVMRKGNKPNLPLIEEIAVKAIKEIYPQMTVSEIKKAIREVLNGEQIGDAEYGRWFDFCCEFRQKSRRRYSILNELCKNITCKERQIISNGRLTIIQKDVIHLILTIELL